MYTVYVEIYLYIYTYGILITIMPLIPPLMVMTCVELPAGWLQDSMDWWKGEQHLNPIFGIFMDFPMKYRGVPYFFPSYAQQCPVSTL